MVSGVTFGLARVCWYTALDAETWTLACNRRKYAKRQ